MYSTQFLQLVAGEGIYSSDSSQLNCLLGNAACAGLLVNNEKEDGSFHFTDFSTFLAEKCYFTYTMDRKVTGRLLASQSRD